MHLSALCVSAPAVSTIRFHWLHKGFVEEILSLSQATIQWDIPATTASGSYRIRHFGSYKQPFTGKIVPYTGTSSTFTVK